MFTSQRQLRQNESPTSSPSHPSQPSSGTPSPLSGSPVSNHSYGRDPRGLVGIDIPANEAAPDRVNSSDTLYFRPKKIYQMEHEHPSRSTLVQLHNKQHPDDADSSYENANVDGGRGGVESGNPCGKQPLYTMGAEYVPDLDFTKLVDDWQSPVTIFTSSETVLLRRWKLKTIVRAAMNFGTRPDAILDRHQLRRDSFSQGNSDSLSPEGSLLSRDLHSNVKPIPLPRNMSTDIHTAFQLGSGKTVLVYN